MVVDRLRKAARPGDDPDGRPQVSAPFPRGWPRFNVSQTRHRQCQSAWAIIVDRVAPDAGFQHLVRDVRPRPSSAGIDDPLQPRYGRLAAVGRVTGVHSSPVVCWTYVPRRIPGSRGIEALESIGSIHRLGSIRSAPSARLRQTSWRSEGSGRRRGC